MKKNKAKKLVLFTLLAAVLVALDQFTKYLAIEYLKNGESIPLIQGVLELHYLENKGAAFGMLQGQKAFILFVGLVFLAVVIFCLIKLPDKPKFNKLYFILGAMTAGGVGNMIDRVRFDYVVDFIYFSLIDFPIFNMADIYVTLSVIAFFIVIIFVYKEDDFDFLNFKQKKFRELK